jgi:hypothetical protein
MANVLRAVFRGRYRHVYRDRNGLVGEAGGGSRTPSSVGQPLVRMLSGEVASSRMYGAKPVANEQFGENPNHGA